MPVFLSHKKAEEPRIAKALDYLLSLLVPNETMTEYAVQGQKWGTDPDFSLFQKYFTTTQFSKQVGDRGVNPCRNFYS